MAFAVFLYVDKPVASLQFDLDAAGSVTSTIDPALQKQVVTNRLPDGKLRVLVYGLNQSVFNGKFASVDSPVSSIKNVVGANPDGTDAGVTVLKVSSPQGVAVEVK